MTVPEPPSVLTPPTTAAATRPAPGRPRGDVDRPETTDVRNPASPASAPEAVNGDLDAPAFKPAWRAASGLEPRA